MSDIIKREAHVHGKLWEQQGEGYFSDKRMARDYVTAILRVVQSFPPSAIVDLGGGTGFICERLIEAGIAEDIVLIALDASDAQLAMCTHPRITPMRGEIPAFRRSDVVGDDGRLMLICRSVLQYAGVSGQRPWLDHIRSQMQPDEWFVHQSGCADDLAMSSALNVLFERMGVDKWVPHKAALVQLLSEAGFEIAEDFPVPSVKMISEQLAFRYGFPPEALAPIAAELRRRLPDRHDALTCTPTGFVFDFPYRVFCCSAVGK